MFKILFQGKLDVSNCVRSMENSAITPGLWCALCVYSFWFLVKQLDLALRTVIVVHMMFLLSEARHYDQFPTSQLVFYWFLIRSRHSTHLHWWIYVSACGTWLKHWTFFWSISTVKVVFTDLWYEVDDQLTCIGEFGSLPRVLLFYECSMWKILQSYLVCGMLYGYIRSTLSEPYVIFRHRD